MNGGDSANLWITIIESGVAAKMLSRQTTCNTMQVYPVCRQSVLRRWGDWCKRERPQQVVLKICAAAGSSRAAMAKAGGKLDSTLKWEEGMHDRKNVDW